MSCPLSRGRYGQGCCSKVHYNLLPRPSLATREVSYPQDLIPEKPILVLSRQIKALDKRAWKGQFLSVKEMGYLASHFNAFLYRLATEPPELIEPQSFSRNFSMVS